MNAITREKRNELDNEVGFQLLDASDVGFQLLDASSVQALSYSAMVGD